MSGLELTALGWTEIATAFGLTAAAIVVLYLVRLRRRVVEVPFVALFREALPDERTTRFFTRLKNLFSLLLILLVAALVALALGLPRWSSPDATPRTVVLVLDGTASMRAAGPGWIDAASGEVEPERESRFEAARRGLLARIEQLGESDRAIVLLAGPHARVLHPLSAERTSLARAVREAEPTDAPGSAHEPLAWARELCQREAPASIDDLTSSAEGVACVVELYTDGGLAGLASELVVLRESGAEARVHLVGPDEGEERPGNVAITALSARRFPSDPTRAEVIVEVTSFATRPSRVALELSADGALAHREVLALPAGASVQRTLDDVDGADALFEARLSRAPGDAGDRLDPAHLDGAHLDGARLDALAIDDVAFARLAPRRRRRVVVIRPEGSAPSNAYLDAALLLDPFLEVTTVAPEAYEASGIPSDRDVLIFDGYTPSSPPSIASLLLSPGAPARGWLAVGEPLERPRFEQQQREHELLAFLALGDVNIASARPLAPAPGDEVVGSDPRGALLVTGLRAETRFVALGLDVRESDLPLRIAWPILLLNTLSYLAPDDLALVEGARTGAPFRLVAIEGGTPRLRLRGEGGAGQDLLGTVRAGVAVFELDRVGVYDVLEPDAEARSEVGADPARVVVANLFDRGESGLGAEAVEGADPLDAEAARAAIGESDREEGRDWSLHALLVGAAIVLLALEWLTFHRRWTA